MKPKGYDISLRLKRKQRPQHDQEEVKKRKYVIDDNDQPVVAFIPQKPLHQPRRPPQPSPQPRPPQPPQPSQPPPQPLQPSPQPRPPQPPPPQPSRPVVPPQPLAQPSAAPILSKQYQMYKDVGIDPLKYISNVQDGRAANVVFNDLTSVVSYILYAYSKRDYGKIMRLLYLDPNVKNSEPTMLALAQEYAVEFKKNKTWENGNRIIIAIICQITNVDYIVEPMTVYTTYNLLAKYVPKIVMEPKRLGTAVMHADRVGYIDELHKKQHSDILDHDMSPMGPPWFAKLLQSELYVWEFVDISQMMDSFGVNCEVGPDGSFFKAANTYISDFTRFLNLVTKYNELMNHIAKLFSIDMQLADQYIATCYKLNPRINWKSLLEKRIKNASEMWSQWNYVTMFIKTIRDIATAHKNQPLFSLTPVHLYAKGIYTKDLKALGISQVRPDEKILKSIIDVIGRYEFKDLVECRVESGPLKAAYSQTVKSMECIYRILTTVFTYKPVGNAPGFIQTRDRVFNFLIALEYYFLILRNCGRVKNIKLDTNRTVLIRDSVLYTTEDKLHPFVKSLDISILKINRNGNYYIEPDMSLTPTTDTVTRPLMDYFRKRAEDSFTITIESIYGLFLSKQTNPPPGYEQVMPPTRGDFLNVPVPSQSQMNDAVTSFDTLLNLLTTATE